MRRLLVISLSVMYLTLSVGVQVYKHYCCGKLKEVSFLEAADKCCGNEQGCSFSNACCDFETVVFKINDEHRDSERLILQSPAEFYSSLVVLPTSFDPVLVPVADDYRGNDPPPVTEKYDLFCARIVYG